MIPSLNRWLLKLNRKINPSLDRVLKNAGGTVERLADRLDFYREQVAEDRRELADRAQAFREEINEAIALSKDSWMAAPDIRESSGASKELVSVRESIPLRETIYGMAELEIALDDRGWKRMLAYATYEFSRYGIQSLILISRLYRIKNPLIRRGVAVSAYYVFGRGMDWSSPDEDANAVLQKFQRDPRNASQLSHSAFTRNEETLWTDGNLFWCFFTDPSDGQTIMRNVDALEVCDIISDPNDSSVAWYYHRQWSEMNLGDNGELSPTQQDGWYYAIGWEDIPGFKKLDRIEGHDVIKDDSGNPIPMLHHKEGYLPKWRFGCPLVYPALDWARAHREFLENLCTTWKALSRIAMQVETKGGSPAIAAIKQTLATTFMNDLNSVEQNPPPVTGSAFISGPNTKLNPIKSAGVTVPASEARQVKLMVCAAFGLGEHFFGEIDSGNLATATALDRPTELMFMERQESWRELVQVIGHYVLKQSMIKPKGQLREAIAKRQNKTTSDFDPKSVLLEMAPLKKQASGFSIREAAKKQDKKQEAITIAVTFPAIVEGDMASRVAAITKALNLEGYAVTGIDEKAGIEMLLQELGYENSRELVDEMYPDYDPDRTPEPEPIPETAPVPGTSGDPLQTAPTNGAPAVPPQQQKAPKLTNKERALLSAVASMSRVMKIYEARN